MSNDEIPQLSTPWLAPVAIVLGACYLGWRLTTSAGVHPLLFWGLLGVEAFAWLRLVLRTYVTWSVTPSALQPARTIRSVDVVVTAYAEPAEIVRAALIGCREIRYPHETWLVDDRHRDDLRELAEEMGVNYVARSEPTNGRTGALNHVLQHTSGDFLLLLASLSSRPRSSIKIATPSYTRITAVTSAA